MSIKIDQAALQRIQKKLGTVTKFAQEARAPMQDTVDLLKEKMQTYPTKDPNAFSKTATDAQRRAYFAKMSDAQKKSGNWGYKRTGSLGRKWTTSNKQVAGGRRGEVGNNTAYAKYVQSFAQQQSFHRMSGWLHEDLAVRRHKDEINRIWSKWIAKELSK
jgi:hypothetical protein